MNLNLYQMKLFISSVVLLIKVGCMLKKAILDHVLIVSGHTRIYFMTNQNNRISPKGYTQPQLT